MTERSEQTMCKATVIPRMLDDSLNDKPKFIENHLVVYNLYADVIYENNTVFMKKAV